MAVGQVLMVPATPAALVTGAGTGIGRAIALKLARDGYRVVLAGRTIERLEATLSEIGGENHCFAVPTDVTDPCSVDTLFDLVEQCAGRLDVLINNAGAFGPTCPIGEYPVGAWRETIDVNLTGAFLCARRAFRVMITQRPSGGRIINIGSLSAHVPRPHAVAYTASKHGISGLTKALALEGRAHGIACGQIDVGNAATELVSQFQDGALQPDGSSRPEPTIAIEHVANAVLYMAKLPLAANVLSLTVMATEMPFVGRG